MTTPEDQQQQHQQRGRWVAPRAGWYQFGAEHRHMEQGELLEIAWDSEPNEDQPPASAPQDRA